MIAAIYTTGYSLYITVDLLLLFFLIIFYIYLFCFLNTHTPQQIETDPSMAIPERIKLLPDIL